MPMDFPDTKSLQDAAKIWKFRQPHVDETEEEFREALHQHVLPKDSIEAFEIKFKVGWDKWTEPQRRTCIMGQGMNLPIGGYHGKS